MRFDVLWTISCSFLSSSSSLKALSLFSSSSLSLDAMDAAVVDSLSIVSFSLDFSPASISSIEPYFIAVSDSSISLASSLSSLYFCAFFACLSREFICLLTSLITSFTRKRFCWVASTFLSAAVFFDLYLVIPAASSMRVLLSSGFMVTMAPTFPCSMIE